VGQGGEAAVEVGQGLVPPVVAPPAAPPEPGPGAGRKRFLVEKKIGEGTFRFLATPEPPPHTPPTLLPFLRFLRFLRVLRVLRSLAACLCPEMMTLRASFIPGPSPDYFQSCPF